MIIENTATEVLIDRLLNEIDQLELIKKDADNRRYEILKSLNKKEKQLVEVLNKQLVNKCVCIKPVLGLLDMPVERVEVKYGIIHSIVNRHIIKIKVFSLSVNNKICWTSENHDAKLITIIDEQTMKNYISDKCLEVM